MQLMSDEKTTKKETTVAKFELKIEGKLESLPKISAFIDETMRQCNIESLRDVYAVQLSVDEACTNIIKHAFPVKTRVRLQSVVFSLKIKNLL